MLSIIRFVEILIGLRCAWKLVRRSSCWTWRTCTRVCMMHSTRCADHVSIICLYNVTWCLYMYVLCILLLVIMLYTLFSSVIGTVFGILLRFSRVTVLLRMQPVVVLVVSAMIEYQFTFSGVLLSTELNYPVICSVNLKDSALCCDTAYPVTPYGFWGSNVLWFIFWFWHYINCFKFLNCLFI